METAAHLVDHVFPQLPARQWVLSLPKRLRWFLRHDRRTVTAVLSIFLRVVEQVLRERATGAAPNDICDIWGQSKNTIKIMEVVS